MIPEDTLLTIHQRIHHPFKGEEIQPGKNGLKSLTFKGIQFIEQNKKKASVYAKMAKEPGCFLTWGIRDGSWIQILEKDGKIQIKQ